MKKNLHIVFFVVWLGIAITWFWVFGLNIFLFFPSFFLFGASVVFFVAVPIFYYGRVFAKWRWWKLGIGFVIMLIMIPITTHIHFEYLNTIEEKALQEFITSVEKGSIPEKFVEYAPEDVKCLANYITPEYSLKKDYFMGVTDWWITFENGETFYITTTPVDLSHWRIHVFCK